MLASSQLVEGTGGATLCSLYVMGIKNSKGGHFSPSARWPSCLQSSGVNSGLLGKGPPKAFCTTAWCLQKAPWLPAQQLQKPRSEWTSYSLLFVASDTLYTVSSTCLIDSGDSSGTFWSKCSNVRWCEDSLWWACRSSLVSKYFSHDTTMMSTKATALYAFVRDRTISFSILMEASE